MKRNMKHWAEGCEFRSTTLSLLQTVVPAEMWMDHGHPSPGFLPKHLTHACMAASALAAQVGRDARSLLSCLSLDRDKGGNRRR